MKGKTNNPSDKLNPLSGKIPQKDGKDKESKPDKSSGPSLLTSFLDGNLGLVGNKKEKEDKPHESQTGDPLDDFKIDIDDVQSGKLLDLEADIEYQKHYKKHNEAKKYGTIDLPQGGLGKDEDKNLPVDQLFRAEDEISDFKVSCFLFADGKKIECNLYDHFENFIIYLTQKVSIQESANVDVDISFSFKDYRVNIKVNGTVASIEDAGDGNIFICIKMKAEDLAKFESLMKQYKIMQQGVTKFIKKGRGVA